jgi:hypothetical protein
VSWSTLDKVRAEAKSSISKDEQSLAESHAKLQEVMKEQQRVLAEQQQLLSRIIRQRKVLQQAEARAKTKAVCLIDELNEEEEEERRKNGGLSDGEIAAANADLSSFLGVADGSAPVDWDAMGFSDEIPIASGEPSSSVT